MQDNEGALRQFEKAHDLDPDGPEIQMEIARVNLYMRNFDAARALLDSLLRREELGAWEQRRVHDLQLQFFQRKAEHLMAQMDGTAALECLEGLMRAFLSCPEDLRDLKMRTKLGKARPTAAQCSRFARDEDSRARAAAVLEWINNETTVTGQPALRGVVCRMLAHGRFGFIRADDGRELYFNARACSRPVSVGQSVEFLQGSNLKGPCAVKVSPAANSSEPARTTET